MLLGWEGLEVVTAVMWYIGMASKRVKKRPTYERYEHRTRQI